MRLQKSVLVVALLSTLTACGGGSGSSGSTVTPPSGTTPTPPAAPPTVGTTGEITGFGSVVVNGVHYSTSASTITTDDKPSAAETDLAVGMVVDIRGSLSSDGKSASATTISYAAHVEGALTFIDLAAKQFTVLNQTIDFDDLTVFDGVSANTLKINDRVEISGYYKTAGQFYASRVELDSKPAQSLKVFGTVAELNSSNQTFKIGTQVVDYSKARLDEFGSAALANGQTVKVKASSVDASTNTLLASEIDLVNKPAPTPDKLRTEGTVSNVVADTSFELAGVKILLTSSTTFDNGSKTDLINGAKVKVQASTSSDGWKADKVVFIKAVVSKAEGKISAVNTTDKTFSLGGETYLVTEQTVLKDDSNRKVRFFDLASLAVNDYVNVVAFKTPQGQLVALKVEREDGVSSDGFIELKGLPSAIAADSLTLFGKKVVVDANTVYLNGRKVLTQQAFFALVKTSTPVEVKATAAGNDLLAVRLKIEDSSSGNDGAVETEFKGLVSEKGADFIIVNSKKVVLTTSTKLRIGKSRDYTVASFLTALKVGVRVEVEGTIDATSGAITARSVQTDD